MLRQTVAQPFLRMRDNFYILRVQTNFFMQLAIHCLLRRFTKTHPALRKLPSILRKTTRPQYLPCAISQNNTYICTKALLINHDNDPTAPTVPSDTAHRLMNDEPRTMSY